MNLTNESPLFEFDSPRGSQPSPALSPRAPRVDLVEALRNCGPIPSGAAFLGVALDGLPVRLNLRDPAPGPLLIVGDPGSGKRRLLQVMARAADLAHPFGEISHVVLTDHTREWEPFSLAPTCEGVLPFRHPLTRSYIHSLSQAARLGASPREYMLLIVDGLEALATDPEMTDDMLWLLENGPAQSIWPIVSVGMPRSPELSEWLRPFRTVLCGRTSGDVTPLIRKPSPFKDRTSQLADTEFAMLSGDDWLPFWVPEPL